MRYTDGFTEAVDIMPTLLDFVGLDAPAQCDGTSLLPVVHAGTFPHARGWRTSAFYEYVFWPRGDQHIDEAVEKELEAELGVAPHQCSLCVVRNNHFKYVHFASAVMLPLLYNLEADPSELHNVAADPAYSSVMLAMAQEMLSRRMGHADRGLTEHFALAGGPFKRKLNLKPSL